MSSSKTESMLTLRDGRFDRLEAIEWWNQELLQTARVIVVGAGALGNEVIKNLALLGLSRVAIVDMDRIEMSNLSRSVLFRENDKGALKAECAQRAARAIYPEWQGTALCGNVLSDVGLGWFRWAQVIVGALDNREARLFLNRASARLQRPWFDGGIEVLNGIVRGFAPPETACYECTMSSVDWREVDQRRSCSLLARRSMDAGGTPTTPTTASIIGAMLCLEVVKHLHGMDCLRGEGYMFEGAGHSSYRIEYPIKPDCEWHEPPPHVEAVPELSSSTSLATVWKHAEQLLGGLDSIAFEREIVTHLECSSCGVSEPVYAPIENVQGDHVPCSTCGAERAPKLLHSVYPGSEELQRTVGDIGLPSWEIVWARKGDEVVGIELSGDAPSVENGNTT